MNVLLIFSPSEDGTLSQTKNSQIFKKKLKLETPLY
jgi:hypothetical protein